MHWLELPDEFLKNLDKYTTENSIIFEGIDFFMVWFFLMTKNYKALAKHMVIVNPNITTQEQAIAFFKERVQRIDVSGYTTPQPGNAKLQTA